jgi:hypothetical protein
MDACEVPPHVVYIQDISQALTHFVGHVINVGVLFCHLFDFRTLSNLTLTFSDSVCFSSESKETFLVAALGLPHSWENPSFLFCFDFKKILYLSSSKRSLAKGIKELSA